MQAEATSRHALCGQRLATVPRCSRGGPGGNTQKYLQSSSFFDMQLGSALGKHEQLLSVQPEVIHKFNNRPLPFIDLVMLLALRPHVCPSGPPLATSVVSCRPQGLLHPIQL